MPKGASVSILYIFGPKDLASLGDVSGDEDNMVRQYEKRELN